MILILTIYQISLSNTVTLLANFQHVQMNYKFYELTKYGRRFNAKSDLKYNRNGGKCQGANPSCGSKALLSTWVYLIRMWQATNLLHVEVIVEGGGLNFIMISGERCT